MQIFVTLFVKCLGRVGNEYLAVPISPGLDVRTGLQVTSLPLLSTLWVEVLYGSFHGAHYVQLVQCDFPGILLS